MELINNMKRLLSGSDVYDESEKLTPQDQVALKNIIQIAKERIWIADPINASEYDDDYFDDYLSEDTLKKMKCSINLMEAYLLKNSTKE